MAISRLIDAAQKAKVLCRDRLFYDQYAWCVSFRLSGATCLQGIRGDLAEYQRAVSNRWNRRNSRRVEMGITGRSVRNLGGSWAVAAGLECANEFKNIVSAAEILHGVSQEIKPIFYHDWIYCYCNDVSLLYPLISQGGISDVGFKQAKVTHHRGTLVRRNPQHATRTYLRDRTLTPAQKNSLSSLLSCQDQVRLGPSLQKWVSTSSIMSSRDYWFDHDGDAIKFMVELAVPGLIGRSKHVTTINN